MAEVKQHHVLIFTQQFSSMIRSNLPLVDVLDNLAEETPQRGLREIVSGVAKDVRKGLDLADAMAEFPRTFDDVYISVVRSGMESGLLGPALEQIAQYQKVVNETARRVRSAMTYPIFVIGAFILVFNIMMFLILPRFESMFASFSRELPGPTVLMLAVGAFWSQYWWLILGGAGATVFVWLLWLSTDEGRRSWDEMKLNIPMFGPLWRMAALAKFLRTFAVQVRNGVGALPALSLSAEASGNAYLREVLKEITASVERGRGIADSFRSYDVFHGIVLQMISSGEESGSLDELLLSSADYFDSLVRDQIDRITSLINPVLTVAVGLGIAAMMVACFLPVFQMGG